MTELRLDIDRSGETLRIAFAGPLLTAGLRAPAETLGRVSAAGARAAQFDLTDLTAIDTGGAWLIVTIMDRLRAEGAEPALTGASADQITLIETVAKAMPEPPAPPRPRTIADRLAGIGQGTIGAVQTVGDALGFFGLVADRAHHAASRTAAVHVAGASLPRSWRRRGAHRRADGLYDRHRAGVSGRGTAAHLRG
jgi:phospholipid/cholesterol/gamma-HCH transport system permease protein